MNCPGCGTSLGADNGSSNVGERSLSLNACPLYSRGRGIGYFCVPCAHRIGNLARELVAAAGGDTFLVLGRAVLVDPVEGDPLRRVPEKLDA